MRSRFLTTVFSLLIITILISCGSEQAKRNENEQSENPKALQDDKLDIKSFSRSGDLMEELYAELVEESPELKKLESDLKYLRLNSNELREKLNSYGSKSSSYYSSADHKAAALTDSLLKRKILAVIAKSKNNYSNRTVELNALLNTISQNDVTLNDHRTVLKIVLTLPIIEKYQTDNLPGKKELKDLIKQQEKLIQKTDSLTPKY